MALTTGTRLGTYEILAPLGAGGMGEVYRARDTKLNRDVALKILPDAFSLDPDRLARFRREAQVLASLNHPNIAAIYGFEESDPSTGSGQAAVQALVLELVDGPTLAEKLAGSGGFPILDALRIATEIAEALEAAHDKGIVHRDLKPANVKLTADGKVKILDFGLAKALDQASGSGLQLSARDVTASPTITSPAMTQMGVILGTAAYMSPEQAKGRPADKRSDVWAFGCVLYEMLTGKRPFDPSAGSGSSQSQSSDEGDDISETLAFVLTKEPDWTALPPNTRASVRRLLQRCLQKDRKRRLADIADARLEIDDARTSDGPTPSSVAASGKPAAPSIDTRRNLHAE